MQAGCGEGAEGDGHEESFSKIPVEWWLSVWSQGGDYGRGAFRKSTLWTKVHLNGGKIQWDEREKNSKFSASASDFRHQDLTLSETF